MEQKNGKDNIEDIYSLTPIQKGMYYHNKLDPASTNYHLQEVFKVNKKIESNTIENAANKLLEKYPTLRTSFVTLSNGNNKQVVLKQRECEIQTTFMSHSESNEATIERIVCNDLKRGFDLKNDSLLRINNIYFADTQFLIFSMHHIIVDGWCNPQIYDDFFKYCYEEITSFRKEPNLFGQYIKWLELQDQSKAEKYWKNLVHDYKIETKLPSLSRTLSDKKGVEKKDVCLSQDTTEKLVELCQHNGVTINNLSELVWGIILQKYLGTDDIIFGKVVSGREAPIDGIEKAMGIFINTIPVRIKTNENESVIDIINKIQKQGLESSQYSFFPLVNIENLMIKGIDFISTLFVFENYPVLENLLEEKRFQRIEKFSREQTNYSLSISFSIIHSVMNIQLLFNTNDFDNDEINILLNRIVNIFESISKNIEKPVREIDWIPSEEISRVFSLTKAEAEIIPKENNSILDYFAKAVKRNPDKIAITFKEKNISYKKLDELSSYLAEKISRFDIKRESKIPIIASTSIESVIVILAILKFGGCYVPLDENLPENRIEGLLEELKPELIFTDLKVSLLKNIKIVLPIQNVTKNNGVPKFNYLKKIEPDNLAYCIFTSGTTGKPKGVLIEHKNVLNLCEFLNKQIYLNAQNLNIALMAPFTFDASIQNLFGSLLFGHHLHIIANEDKSDPHLLIDLFERNSIDVCDGTPTHLKNFINANVDLNKLPNILLIGGEKLPLDIVNNIYSVNNNIDIFNMYGPTEATVDSIYHKCERNMKKMVIGRPIDNVEVYVLDDSDHLVGIGVIGEICIAGEGVGRGYLNRENLTEQKFKKNPFGKGKIYRTGDYGKYLVDGTIEYIGRKDSQVKLHGYRIELSEIESNIKNYPNIRDCVVVVKENDLLVYVISEHKINYQDLRNYLESKLPNYMVPVFYKQIPEIPTFSNGKTNFEKLPKIIRVIQKQHVLPVQKKEKEILNAFKKALSIDILGMTDNFFEMGGNSIKLIILQQELLKIEIEVTLKELKKFNTPSLIYNYLNDNKTISVTNKEDDKMLDIPLQLKKIQEPKAFFKDCFYSAFLPALEFFGIRQSQLISNTIFLFNFKEKYLKFEPLTIKTDKELLKDEELDLEIFENVENLKEFLIDKLKNSLPIIVPVDPFYNSNRLDTYKKIHANHFLLIAGYDKRTSDFVVVDHSHIDTPDYKLRRISNHDLLSSHNGLKLNPENAAEIWVIKSLKNKNRLTPKEILNQYLKNMNNEEKKITNSIISLEEYNQEFKTLIEKNEIDTDFLNHLTEITNAVINGKKSEKIIFVESDFLLGISLLDELIQKWESLRYLLFKQNFSKGKANYYDRILNVLYKIINLEKNYNKFIKDQWGN